MALNFYACYYCLLLLAFTASGVFGTGEVQMVLERLNREGHRVTDRIADYNSYDYVGKRVSGNEGMFNVNGNKVSVSIGDTTFSDLSYDNFYSFDLTELYATSAQPFTLLWWIEHGTASKYAIKVDHDRASSTGGEMEQFEGEMSVANDDDDDEDAATSGGNYNFNVNYKSVQLFNRPNQVPSACLTFFTVISEYFVNAGELPARPHLDYSGPNHVEAYIDGQFRYVLFGYALYSKENSERMSEEEVRQAINATIQILYDEVADQEGNAAAATEPPEAVDDTDDHPIGSTEFLCDGDSSDGLLSGDGTISMIKSSNYPNHYDKNSDCWMTKRAPEGHRIEIMFLTPISIEGCCDFLEIYDAASREEAEQEQAALLVHGNQIKNFISESNHVTLRFFSDSSVEDNGFTIGIRAVSEGESDDDDSTVHRILGELRKRNERMRSLLGGSFYEYVIPQSGALIEDGGHDMFDNGNLISFGEGDDIKENEHYGKFVKKENYEFLTDAGPIFFALLWSDSPDIRSYTIQVVGNAGADGHGESSELRGEMRMFGFELEYFVFQIAGSGDASICEVYFTISNEKDWGSRMDDDADVFEHLDETNRMNSKLTALGSRFLLGYSLLSTWSEEEGGRALSNKEIKSFLNEVLISAAAGFEKAHATTEASVTQMPDGTTAVPSEPVSGFGTTMGRASFIDADQSTAAGTTRSPLDATTSAATEAGTTRGSTTGEATTAAFESTTGARAVESTTGAEDWSSHRYKADMRDISPKLISVARAIYDQERSLAGAVDRFFPYEYGEGDRVSIEDGGHDMYDEGNKVSFGRDQMMSEPVFYNSKQTHFYKAEDVQFFAQAEHPFVAMLHVNDSDSGADEKHSYSIMVEGNAGADSEGRISELSGTFHLGSLNADYNVFQISGASEDPTICEVFFVVYDRENWNSVRYRNLDQFEHMTETNVMRNQITICGNNIVLVYMLLSRHEPNTAVTRNEVHNAMRPILDTLASVFSNQDYSGEVATFTFRPNGNGANYNEVVRDFGSRHLHFRTGDDDEDGEDDDASLSLWAVSQAIERESGNIKSHVRHFYDYAYTLEDESSIGDGGSDMFDGGNMISFGEDERYVDRYAYNKKFRGQNFEFTSRAIHPFHALMLINSTDGADHQYLIRVRGNAGADDFGSTAEMRGTVVQEETDTYGRLDLDYYVFQISDAQNDPTICEVYFVVHSEMWDSVRLEELDTFTHLNETNSLDSRLSIHGKNLLLGFTLFSRHTSEGERNSAITEEEIEGAMRSILSAISTAYPAGKRTPPPTPSPQPETQRETTAAPVSPSDNLVERLLEDLTEETMEQVMDAIPGFHRYSYDGEGSSIRDGGSDMFDDGNKVSVYIEEDDVHQSLEYNTYYKIQNYAFGSKTTHPFVALAWIAPQDPAGADILDLYSLEVTGDPGADMAGDEESYEDRTIYWGEFRLDYSVQQLSNAEDPSICQVFFYITSQSQWGSRITEEDFDSVENLDDRVNRLSVRGENVLLGYILLSKESGGRIDDFEIQSALQPLLEKLAVGVTELAFSGAPSDAAAVATESSSAVRGILTSAVSSLVDDEDDENDDDGMAALVEEVGAGKWHAYVYDGASSSSIGDGGSDMYDDGNKVSFAVGENSYFRDTGAVYNQSFLYEDYGFTSVATHPFVALLWNGEGAEGSGIREAMINVTGNAGADSEGAKTAKSVESTEREEYEYDYDVSQVSGAATDPSICEVFFRLSSAQRWESVVSTTEFYSGSGTNELHNSYQVTGKNFLIGYVLLSKKNAEAVSDDEVREVVEELVERIFPAIDTAIANLKDAEQDDDDDDDDDDDNVATTARPVLAEEATTRAPMPEPAIPSTSDDGDDSTTAPAGLSVDEATAAPPADLDDDNDDNDDDDDDVDADDHDGDMDVEDFMRLVRRVNQSTTPLMAENIESFYRYSYDGGASFIQDGGSDMYDTGNAMSVRVDDSNEFSVEYNRFYQTEDFFFSSGSVHPFFALLFANSSDGESHEYKLRVFGNAGTDGSGSIHIFKGTVPYGRCSINYDVFELSGTTDPSICELYFSMSCEQWNSSQEANYFSYMSGKDVLRSVFMANGNRILIGYFLLSKQDGRKVSQMEVERALHIFSEDMQRPLRPGEYYGPPKAGGDNDDDDDDDNDDACEAIVKDILREIGEETAEKMRDAIPEFHSYLYDGEDNYSITDGGTDMYDRGNEIKFGKDGKYFGSDASVVYNQTDSDPGVAWGTIAVHPFVAILWANESADNSGTDDSSNYTITVHGDAGADGNGDSGLMKGSLTLGNFHLDYDVFQISGAGDASICEVYFVVHSELWGSEIEHEPVLSHTQGSSTLHAEYTVDGDNFMMGYTLLSRKGGAAVTEIQVRSALRPLLLEIADSFTDDISIAVQIPEGDVALTPTCTVRGFTDRLLDNCIEDNGLLTPRKFEGAAGCRSHVVEFLSCASELLMDCTWSVSQSQVQVVDIIAIQKYVKNLIDTEDESNDALDVFCHHAPLGLPFPFPCDETLDGACDGDFADALRDLLASFYRKFAWSNSPADINRWYEETEDRLVQMMNTRCLLSDLTSLYPSLTHTELHSIKASLRRVLDVFMEQIKENDDDDDN